MNVGFTGTRNGMTFEQRVAFLGQQVPIWDTFHHGGCRGADVEAARLAAYHLRVDPPEIVCHPAPGDDPNQESSGVDDRREPPKNHLARNRDIVDACDLLIACPPTMKYEPKGGTWYTIRYAQKKGKPVTIIWPNGAITNE